MAQPKEVIANRGWEPGTPPRSCRCRASLGCCLCKVLVTGRRECGYKHDELTEVHLGISVGIEVLEQSAHSILVPSALEERGPESVMQVLSRATGTGATCMCATHAVTRLSARPSCVEQTLGPWKGHTGSECRELTWAVGQDKLTCHVQVKWGLHCTPWEDAVS